MCKHNIYLILFQVWLFNPVHSWACFTEMLSLSFSHTFHVSFSAQITLLIRAQRGIHFSALPWQSKEEGVFSLTGAVTLINDPLIAACLPGNTVHTLCHSLSLTHTSLSLPLWLAVQLTHTLRSLYMLIGATSPLTNSYLMSCSSPPQRRARLSLQGGRLLELWEVTLAVYMHWVTMSHWSFSSVGLVLF